MGPQKEPIRRFSRNESAMKTFSSRILLVFALTVLVAVLGCSSSLRISTDSALGQPSASVVRNVTLSNHSQGGENRRLEPTEAQPGFVASAVAGSPGAQTDPESAGIQPNSPDPRNGCSSDSQGVDRNTGLRVVEISFRIPSGKSNFAAWIALGTGVMILLIAMAFHFIDRSNQPK